MSADNYGDMIKDHIEVIKYSMKITTSLCTYIVLEMELARLEKE